MKRLLSSLLAMTGLAGLHVGQANLLAENLYAVEWQTGRLFLLGTVDSSRRLVANLGVSGVGSLELGPDGYLYATGTLSTSSAGLLYRIDPRNGSVLTVGSMGVSPNFEGGIAISPTGAAYAVNEGSASAASLFTIDLTTGNGTLVGLMGAHDINGLAWRSDGMLVGLDRETNSIVEIDPATARTTVLAPLSPVVGAAGGMTISGLSGYFSTSGPGASIPGSHELWSFDPFTGAAALSIELPEQIGGIGLSGLSTTTFASVVGTPDGPEARLVAPASSGALALMLGSPGPMAGVAAWSGPRVLFAGFLDGSGRMACALPAVGGRAAPAPWAGFVVLDPTFGPPQISPAFELPGVLGSTRR